MRILMISFFAGVVGIAVGAVGYAGTSEYSLANAAITDYELSKSSCVNTIEADKSVPANAQALVNAGSKRSEKPLDKDAGQAARDSSSTDKNNTFDYFNTSSDLDESIVETPSLTVLTTLSRFYLSGENHDKRSRAQTHTNRAKRRDS